MARKQISVVEQTETGRNEQFRINGTGEVVSREELVGRIDNGEFPNYHTREIQGVKTPVSNPDGKEGNNLG